VASWENLTEADLEARIAAILKAELPFLSPGAIRHQLRFSVRLGGKQIEIDGKVGAAAIGRLDILLIQDNCPIAVLELKRPGTDLHEDDRAQGQSYARLLDPMAPLVIVSNGAETRIYRTYNGTPWKPSNPEEETVEALLEKCAQLALHDQQKAIATLLGPTSTAARSIINGVSEATIADLTGEWDDRRRPFGNSMSFARTATMRIAEDLDRGKRIVILSGAPLAGKSNVLRELWKHYTNSDRAALLFIEGSSIRHGVLRSLADALSRDLDWQVSPEDARNWLLRMSKQGLFRFILAIDDCDPETMAEELDNLSSNAFGLGVRIVLTCDLGAVRELTQRKSQLTRLGRLSSVRELEPLDDEEFNAALAVLHDVRIDFMHGAQLCDEYRNPWVLRAIAADAAGDEKYYDTSVSAAIPSLPGLMLMEFASQRLRDDDELRARHAGFARAVLDGVSKKDATLSLVRLTHRFVSLRKALLLHLTEGELADALGRGEFKSVLLPEGERVVTVQMPELIAAELSRQLSSTIAKEATNDPKRTADELTSICQGLPLGDVIGAQAIVEASLAVGHIPGQLITALLERPPRLEAFNPGSRFRLAISEDRAVDIEVDSERRLWMIGPHGLRQELDDGPDAEENPLIVDIMPWMILSYMGAMRIAAFDQDKMVGWLEPAILIAVAKCPTVLRLPSRYALDGIHTHHHPQHGSIACHSDGVIEPITLALIQAILRDRESGEYLVFDAIESNSVPFLARLDTAFKTVAGFQDADRRNWARQVLKEQITPHFRLTPFAH
jgi:hypothetical protein